MSMTRCRRDPSLECLSSTVSRGRCSCRPTRGARILGVARLVLAAVGSLARLRRRSDRDGSPRRRKRPQPATAGSAEPAFEIDYPSKLGDRPDLGAGLRDARPGGGRGSSRGSGPNWFRPQPFFAVEAKDWKPGRAAADRRRAPSASPARSTTLEPGRLRASRRSSGSTPTRTRSATARGTPTGRSSASSSTPEAERPVTLDGRPARAAPDVPGDRPGQARRASTARSSRPSTSRPIKHRAAVILPEGRPGRRSVPALYIIPGFGGDHHMARPMLERPRLGLRQGPDPRRPRPRLRHRPPRLRRLGHQRPARARRWSRS